MPCSVGQIVNYDPTKPPGFSYMKIYLRVPPTNAAIILAENFQPEST
jgi:hypothetical protein